MSKPKPRRDAGRLMDTLQELLDAGLTDVTAMLDNDVVTFVRGDTDLLELHPYEVQVQALAALGIKTEAV